MKNGSKAKGALQLAQFALDHAPDAVYWMEPGGRFLYVNEAACRALGYTREELLSMGVADIDPNLPDGVPPEMHEATKKTGIGRLETEHRAKDGRIIPVEVMVTYIEYNGKEYYCSFARDITERKRAEKALLKANENLEARVEERTKELLDEIAERKRVEQELKESIEKFTQLANNIEEVFWLTGVKEEKVYYVSPAYEKIWGRRIKDVYRDPKSWSEAIHPDDYEMVKRTNAQCRSSNCKSGFDIEYRIVFPDGSLRWIRDRSFPVRDISGKVYRIAGIAEDVTGRKVLENEKTQLQAQLIQAQKMEAIGTLAGGIAHDFNNIMTVVKNLTSLAMNKAARDSNCACYLEPIRKVSERGINLVQQLLIFSQNKPVELSYFNMNNVIGDILDVISTLISEDISIDKELAQGLWDIKADRGRIEQVITNLVINSKDSMLMGGVITLRTGNITLTADKAASIQGASPGSFICLTVEDTGKGMDKDIIEHIFEPFFTTKAPNGTGLGLSVVYGIVNELGGWINVASKPGSGTRFMVYLPISTGPGKTVKEKPAAKKAFDGAGRRILLVEDDKWVRKSTAMVLSENGYVVFEASSAEQAISLFYKEKGKFDLVMSDVVMPGRSGLQMVSPMLDVNPKIPILLCSGHLDDKAQLDQIVKRGLSYIHKPYEIEELLQAVEEIIEGNLKTR